MSEGDGEGAGEGKAEEGPPSEGDRPSKLAFRLAAPIRLLPAATTAWVAVVVAVSRLARLGVALLPLLLPLLLLLLQGKLPLDGVAMEGGLGGPRRPATFSNVLVPRSSASGRFLAFFAVEAEATATGCC